MSRRTRKFRVQSRWRFIGVSTAIMALLFAGMAQSAVRYAGGNNGIINPSSADNYALGPWRISENVTTTGASTSPLQPGQKITLMGGVTVVQSAPPTRVFGPFNFVAQLSKNVASTRGSDVVLSAGNGAAAIGNISYCPPINDTNPLNGNLSCALTTQAGPGTYGIAIRIAKTGNNNGFGGVYSLMQNVQQDVWWALSPFVPLGNTTQTQVVSHRQTDISQPWTPGLENFSFLTAMRSKGPRYRALLTNEPDPPGQNIQGGIMTLLNPDSPTPPVTDPPTTNKGWGFRMTTGVVSGSDKVPAATSFVSTGQDTVTPSGSVRNLVLIGGGIAVSQGTQLSLYNNLMRMRFSLLAVPEPGAVAACCIGLLWLAGLARIHRS